MVSGSKIFSLTILLLLGVNSCSILDSYKRKPNVLLITVDTLRADHLSSYGYKRNTTPNIDQLAREGVLFLNTISQIPETLPSMTSIMTSSYPIDHGVRKNGYRFLSDKKLLSEILRDNDYTTAAFISSCVLDKGAGLTRGFDIYDDTLPDRLLAKENCQRTAEKTTMAVIEWIERNYKKRFFIWLHYIDPHSQYRPPSPYNRMFLKEPYKGRVTGDVSQFFSIIHNRFQLDKKDIEYMISLYDGEIAFVDYSFGLLLKKIRELNLTNNTLIVFTSDHGESLGEHNYFFDHGDFLYDDQLRVPLIMSGPGLPDNKVIKRQVQTIDIMPTILDLLKISTKGKMTGRSLLPLLLDNNENMSNIKEEAFSESDICQRYGVRRCSPVGIKGKLYPLRIENRWKYIFNPNGESELYDIANDPSETRNLINANKKLAGALERRLKGLINNRGAQHEQRLSKEMKEKLKSLGYLK